MRAPLSLNPKDYRPQWRWRCLRHLPLGAVKDDLQSAWPELDRGARRGRRNGRSPSPATPSCRGTSCLLPQSSSPAKGCWWTGGRQVMISSSAADLRRYPASSTAYLRDGLPPNPQWGGQVNHSHAAKPPEGDVGATCGQRPARFLPGDLAQSIAADVQASGGTLSTEDLAAFRAHVREPLAIPYRGGTVYATPEPHLWPYAGARAASLATGIGAVSERAGRTGLCGLCAGVAVGLSRAG